MYEIKDGLRKMKRDIPFDPELPCDNCDEIGAYDFMGEYLCPRCADFHIEEEPEFCEEDIEDMYDLWDFVA